MNRIEDYEVLRNRIVEWIKTYAEGNGIKSLVVGVSGGIDSAVTSTLAAETGLMTYCIGMPLLQNEEQESLSDIHLDWLGDTYWDTKTEKFDLTDTFQVFEKMMRGYGKDKLALANSRSRLRMVTLYQVAQTVGGIVVGTGNKVEDYGIGFYTKYGDGGVDIAPIADLYKSEVWELGRHLGVNERIINAQPTDGLWEDGRTDEDQIGVSYAQLEEAMEHRTGPAVEILDKFSKQNRHKMEPIPTFKL
jgi:NAD+ synthase